MTQETEPEEAPIRQNEGVVQETDAGWKAKLVAPDGMTHEFPSPYPNKSMAENAILSWSGSFGIVVGKLSEAPSTKTPPPTPPPTTTTPPPGGGGGGPSGSGSAN